MHINLNQYKYRPVLLLFVFTLLLSGCTDSYSPWKIEKVIALNNERPMGITHDQDNFWISDGFNNSIDRYDSDFNFVESIEGFERPMHISSYDGTIYIPEYGTDGVVTINKGIKDTLNIPLELNAPAGFSREKDLNAVVNFYGNSITIGSGDNWKEIGKDGEADGEFHAPTDIQIYNDTIYVADAYNNRVQLFDKQGRHIRTIGEELGMDNAAGIYVTSNEIFVTDFENHRVLALDRNGLILNEILEGLDNPIDLIINDNNLYIINFGSGDVTVLSQLK